MAATQVWTIGSLLAWNTEFFTKKNIDEPRLSAELLLAHALACTRMALYTQYERVPPEDQIAVFRDLVKQRAAHVPVAYLIGKGWFFSLEFKVTRDVLIPRPDTETLVEFVLQQARQRPEWTAEGGAPALLDLCTGSGIIAITLAKRMPTAMVTAVDLSAKALEVAKENAVTHGVMERVTFLQGDLYEPLATVAAPMQFRVVTANPPYIPSKDIANLPETIREHEPRMALDGGGDGMDFHRRIIEGIRPHIQSGGLLIVEIQYDQGEKVQALFAAAGGFTNVRVIR